MRRLFPVGVLAFAVAVFAPATASAQQSLNLYLGGFVPRGEDARTDGDVIVNNLSFLAFNLKDFNSPAVGGEWLFGLTDRLEGSLGVGLSKRTVPSIYADFIEDDGTEIEQDLKLRIVPFTALVRFVPLGRDAAVQPYIGAGVGIFSWRYSETGEFVDFRDGSVYRDRFVGSGATAGPVILGGLQFPLGAWAIGGEVRYQSAQGELPTDQGFAGTKIDLGGFTYSATFRVRF
jgi:hypothetical protein